MWPGIIEITDVRQQEDELRYRQGQICVVYALQNKVKVPVATGHMTQNFDSDHMEWQKKGKCVQIDHHLFDELWNMGDKKIP